MDFQDVFHMGTHWLQAGGIFRKILDPFMNAQPDLPLKKLRGADEALKPEQVIMLFVVWGFGITCALISFVGEFWDGVLSLQTQKRKLDCILLIITYLTNLYYTQLFSQRA